MIQLSTLFANKAVAVVNILAIVIAFFFCLMC